MSKTTSKQKYIQLKEWLSTFKPTTKSGAPKKKFSKANFYKQTRERYGYKKSN